MQSRFLVLALLLPLVAALAASAAGPMVEAPAFDASDSSAPEVDATNLYRSERFWPYQLTLVQPWTPPGADQPLPAATRAVLVRVEESGELRVDFGRDGRFQVPLEVTDVVSRANEVRLGTRSKIAPNFVLAVGPRLTDTAYDGIRAVPFDDVYLASGFLAVFAPPDRLAELAAELAPLEDRHGIWTVLFPQGRVEDSELRKRLRAMDWQVPFLFDNYSESYTRSRLTPGTELPAVMLQTPEGRVVYESSWTDETAAELRAAMDAHFASESVARGAVAR